MAPTKRRADPPKSGKRKSTPGQDPSAGPRPVSGAPATPEPIEPQASAAQRLRLFEKVSEGSLAGIYVYQDGRFLYVNPAMADIFGYSREELQARVGPADLTHPDDRPKVAEYIRRREAGEVESVHYTFRGLRKDGGLIHCEVLGQMVELDGKPAIAGTLLDITDRERTERDLLESEALFRGLAVKSPNAIFINQRGHVVYANPAAEELMGYSQVELTSPEFDFLRLIAPESLAGVQENFREHLQGREQPPHEARLVRKDGQVLDSLIATRLISYKGEPAILGIITDVTERKTAERQLERLLQDEHKHRRLAEAVARVGLSLTADLELQQVLDLISRESTEVFGVSSAFVWLVDGEELVGFAGHGVGREGFLGRRLHLADTTSMAPMVIREARPSYINNARSSPIVNQELLGLFGAQSILGVPLFRVGKPEGALVLLDIEDAERFKDEDLETAMILGGQMALAIESAQIVRRERRRTRQLTYLIQSSNVISSTLDLDNILGHITEEMCNLIEATSAYICTYDPEDKTSTVVAEYYGPEAVERESDLGQTYNLEEEFPGTVEDLEAGRPMIAQVDDPQLSESERRHMLHYGGKSTLTIPFVAGGKVRAYAELWESRLRREFTEEEIELCLAIGRHAAIAVENGRLYQRVKDELSERRRAESELSISVAQLERAVLEAERLAATEAALRDSAAALSSTLNLDEVLDHILANVGRVVPSDTVDIMLLGQGETSNILFGVRGRGYRERGLEGWLESQRLPVEDVPNFRRIVNSGRPYAISDVRTAVDWLEFPGTEWIRSYAAAPIRSKGLVVGVLNLCSETAGFYTPAHADLLQTFADQAAVAIDNARLFTQANQELEERQRAELELRQLSEFSESILNEMADGVAVQDRHGNFAYINPAAASLFGYTQTEMLGKHWTSFLSEDQQRVVEAADARRRQGVSDRYEVQVNTKSGQRIPVLISGRPRRENGKFAGTVAVFTDISERKRVEEAEREFLRTKEEFLISASHSLRTPLHTLLGFLELLAGDQVDDPEVRKDFLSRALQDARHLGKLVEDVVGTAKMEAGSVELNLKTLRVDVLLSDTLPSYESLAQENGIELTWNSQDPPPQIRADRDWLRQALGNLVENAIRYSDRGTAVQVEAGQKGDGVEIRVIDHGPGISEVDLAALFEKPYLRPTDDPGGRGGTGLGLYLTRTIVEAHGGSVGIESQVGRGSIFTIIIPGR